jgi:hypothetical protein
VNDIPVHSTNINYHTKKELLSHRDEHMDFISIWTKSYQMHYTFILFVNTQFSEVVDGVP